jgi:hypothetical protein
MGRRGAGSFPAGLLTGENFAKNRHCPGAAVSPNIRKKSGFTAFFRHFSPHVRPYFPPLAPPRRIPASTAFSVEKMVMASVPFNRPDVAWPFFPNG